MIRKLLGIFCVFTLAPAYSAFANDSSPRSRIGPLVTATSQINTGETLSAAHVACVLPPKDAKTPAGAYSQVSDVVGQVVKRDIAKGAYITSYDIVHIEGRKNKQSPKDVVVATGEVRAGEAFTADKTGYWTPPPSYPVPLTAVKDFEELKGSISLQNIKKGEIIRFTAAQKATNRSR